MSERRHGGGLRIRWLARLTHGRLSAGRWTAEEVAEIKQRAAQALADVRPYID